MDRTLRVILTADSAGMVRGLAEADAAADAAADAGEDMGGKLEKAGGKAGNIFSRLGSTMQNWGIPFGKTVSDMGEKMGEVESKASRFSGIMSDIGKVTLGVGAAAAVGIGVESLHLSDEFDTAQSQMDTAIVNVGGSVTKLQVPLKALYGQMANLGFNMTDTASAMTVLTIATGKPTLAMKDMGVAADLARLKNISLSSAAQVLAKVYAGSTRALTQLGLNLDIGSGKLSAIRTATEGVTTAQIALKNTEEGVADGQIKASQAATELRAAHHSLADAELKLHLDQSAIATILRTVTERTHGAAAAFGKTLPGQMDIAKAHLENLGISFGQLETKGIKVVERGLVSVITWFEKNSWAAKLLAGIIGTVLGGAVVTFGLNKASQFVKGVQSMGQAFGQLVSKIVTGGATSEVAEEGLATTSEAAGEETEASFGPIGIAIAALGIAFLLLKDHWHTIWKDIKDVATAAWHFLDSDVFHPIARFFEDTFLGAIRTAQHIWDSVWRDIKHVIDDAWSFIKGHIALIVGIFLGPFVGAIVFVATHWHQTWDLIKRVASDVWHFLDNDILHPIISFFTGSWHSTVSAVGSAWHTLWGGIKTAVSAVWSFLEPIFHAITSAISTIVGGIGRVVGDIAHVGGNVLHFLHLGTGGLVTKPTMAIIGEQGPELVLNQQQTRLVMSGGAVVPSSLHTVGNGGGVSSPAAAGSGGPVILELHAYIDGKPFFNASAPDIRAALLRLGRSRVNLGLS